MQIPQTPSVLVFRCYDPEQAWIDHVTGCQEQEQREAIELAQHEEDLALRLNGPCECCGEGVLGALAIDGNEAVCVECFGGDAEGIDQL